MSETVSSTPTLRMYVNDMVALERQILAALEKQKEDERVRENPAIADLIGRVHTTTRVHLLTMENHAAAFGGEAGPIKEAISNMAGTIAAIYDLMRKHPVSRMLRNDFTALTLTATAYSMLYTMGMALRELPIARVALRHLHEITPLVMELSHLIPASVVHELAQDGLDVDLSVIPLAREKTQAAWGAASSSAHAATEIGRSGSSV